jgi:hypothetical protein
MFRRCWVVRCARSGPFDPYKILGLSPSATPQDIKKRYHELALRFHPDSGKPGSSKERFQAVQEAYEAVKDGKWAPGENPRQEQQSKDGYGFDHKSKMYVYEQPGSTSDNYVSANGQLQTVLRVVMVWCFGFFVLRFALLRVFPPSKEEAERRRALRLAEAVASASVHSDAEDEAAAAPAVVDFSTFSSSLQANSGWSSTMTGGR